MTKPNCKFILAHIALSSTLFVAPLAIATTFGPGIVAGPISTSTQADNTIEVLATGAIINAGGNAINLDSFAGTVITDPLNTLLGAGSILSTGGAGRGILISANQGTVDIGTSSGVRSTANHGIEITGQDSQLFLSGFVTSSAAASAIFNSGANTMITNNSGAVIAQSVSTTNPTLLSSGNNFSLYNAGTITQRAVANTTPALLINAPFNEIVNLSGGIIQNIYGAAGLAHTLQISGAATSGDIFNEAGGLIYNDGGGVAVNIGIDTNINFINAGKIENGGNTNAIIYAGNIDSFFNSGSIISRSATTIFATANVNIPGMFINNGDITNQTPGNSAIDFASFPPISITYVQDAGTVTGNVLLAQFDSQGGQNVFFMNGGTIAGSVFTFASPSTLALNGGTISGNVVGNTLADTFNLSGTMVLGTLNGGDGNDIFNITGGSYAFLDGGLGLDQVNFNNTFSSQGVISNVESVNVNTGTLTLNNNIINMGSGAGGTGLTITPGATLLLNAGISGQNNIINDGTFSTNSAQVINLSGAGVFTNENGSTLHLGFGAGLEIFTVAGNGFTSLAGSTFSVDLQSATQYGHLIVNSPGANSINFNAGSVIAPKVAGFIPQNAVLGIVTNAGIGGTISDGSLVQQSSAIVTFAKSSNALTNQILLTANRNPYELFAIDPTQGLAQALDFAAQGDGPDDANLLYLLGQIDGLATSDEVSQALISLTPPSNNGLVQASFSGMNVSFERINERMYDLHLWMEQQARLQSGINNGDKFGVLGFWAQALGASLNQNGRDGLAGYDANSKGLALGVDWRYNDCSALGFAISYNKADVNDKNQNPKDENIRSWQGTTYAWIDLANGMYVNGILGLAFNDYDVDRTIRFNQINRVSHGNFDGWQFGLQTDAGWFLINNNEYFVTPFARLKYTLLNLDNYTETGAGALSLSVESQSLDQLLGGVGVKFGKPFVSKHLVFIPEITTFLSYDFVNDGEQTTASFVGNSLAFDTNGITPGKVAFDFGVGVSTHIDEQSIFTIKYDLTLRNHFNANSGYLEYYYLWG